MSTFKLTPSHFKKFFATMNRATSALGLRGEAAKGYYALVLKEVANCSSIKSIASAKLFDDCIIRFTTDAGEYAQAIDYEHDKLKRYGYVIKVLTYQILQLERLDETHARAYFNAVASRARGSCGFFSSDGSFYLDLTIPNLLLFIRILDTHLRRLKRRHFPTFPLSFDDRVRYTACGDMFLREDVEKSYYATLPFSLRVNGNLL